MAGALRSSLPDNEQPTMPYPQPAQKPSHQQETTSPEAHGRYDSRHPSHADMHGAVQAQSGQGLAARPGQTGHACPGSRRHVLADVSLPLQDAPVKGQHCDTEEGVCSMGQASAECKKKRPSSTFKRWRQKKVKRGSLQDIWFRKGQVVQAS